MVTLVRRCLRVGTLGRSRVANKCCFPASGSSRAGPIYSQASRGVHYVQASGVHAAIYGTLQSRRRWYARELDFASFGVCRLNSVRKGRARMLVLRCLILSGLDEST